MQFRDGVLGNRRGYIGPIGEPAEDASAPSRLSFRVAAFARTRETRVLANAATRKLRLDDSLVSIRMVIIRIARRCSEPSRERRRRSR